MTYLERTLVRFKAFWIEAYPDKQVPETIAAIRTWHTENQNSYRTINYLPATGWVDPREGRLSDDVGEQQYRVNKVLNEASLIEILTREPDQSEGYW